MNDETYTQPVTISSMFSKYENMTVQSRTHTSERGELIDSFLNRLNPPREERKLKPLRAGFLSKFFADRKMDNHQIYAFFKDCDRAKNFSSYFWWSTRVDK